MNAIISSLNFIKTNWKLVLVLFGLGGTVTVLGVIPGTEGVSKAVGAQIDTVKEKLVSPTTAQ